MPWKDKNRERERRRERYKERKEENPNIFKERYARNREHLLKLQKKYRRTIKSKYRHYKNNPRKIPFRLSLEEFKSYWKKSCYYCNEPIETIGLDRIDNEKFYKIDNIVPCCKRCNFFKGTMHINDFLKLCRRITRITRGREKSPRSASHA